jgi:hypothetical protein
MALQQLKERKTPVWNVFPITETVAGFDGACLVTGLTGNGAFLVGSSWFSNVPTGMSFGCLSYAGASDYDSEFVSSILQADAAAPEASFNNVVDMLDWLNRD